MEFTEPKKGHFTYFFRINTVAVECTLYLARPPKGPSFANCTLRFKVSKRYLKLHGIQKVPKVQGIVFCLCEKSPITGHGTQSLDKE